MSVRQCFLKITKSGKLSVFVRLLVWKTVFAARQTIGDANGNRHAINKPEGFSTQSEPAEYKNPECLEETH